MDTGGARMGEVEEIHNRSSRWKARLASVVKSLCSQMAKVGQKEGE